MHKVPAQLGAAAAAITMTENGIKLIYDIDTFATMDTELFDFILSHELLHVVNFHFLRSAELMAELSIGKNEFFTKYAPYADLPVNYALSDFPGYAVVEKQMLTYDTTDIAYDTHPTFESIVRYLKLQNHKTPPPACTIVRVSEDGLPETIQDGGNKAPVVVIPQVDEQSKQDCVNDVVDLLRQTAQTAGNVPEEIQKVIDTFLDEQSSQVINAWAYLEQMLVGERSLDKGSVRSYARLNRRTRMLPGRKKITGFSALFIIDESGSMGDEEVQLAFTLVKKVVLRENNDTVYVIHWDTEPVSDVDELQYESDMAALERKKSGGTSFLDFFSHDIFMKHDYDLYICITDGYPSRWPIVEADKPVVWILTEHRGFEKWKNEYAKGLAVCVEQ